MASERSDAGGNPALASAADAPLSDKTTGSARRAVRPWPDWLHRGWSVVAASGALSLLWAAYTYSDQQAEQRRQDFLQAYNLVAGDLGQSVVASITAAIEPFYAAAPITDPNWIASRSCYDQLEPLRTVESRETVESSGTVEGRCFAGASESVPTAQQRTLATLQNWILAHVLVKDGRHDGFIHKYQSAANDLRFLYQYAMADPCNWVVVAFKFKKNAYDFWYYYPGWYDFTGPKIAPLSRPAEASLLDSDKEQDAQAKCLDGFTSIPHKIVEPIAAPIRSVL